MRSYPSVFFLPFAFPGLPQVGCAFTTRMGGVSAAPFDRGNMSLDVGDFPERVTVNRRALKAELGFLHWQELNQRHGVEIVHDPTLTDIHTGGMHAADGQTTDRQGRALVIKTADCQPILLAHAEGKAVAALHVGWRGNVAGFPQLGVAAFCERYGFPADEVLAVRGPSLGPGSSEFVNFEGEFGDAYRPWFDESTDRVNLWALTRDQLIEAGLKPGNIFGIDLCTHAHSELFFSYRRERRSGRQVGLIWIKY